LLTINHIFWETLTSPVSIFLISNWKDVYDFVFGRFPSRLAVFDVVYAMTCDHVEYLYV